MNTSNEFRQKIAFWGLLANGLLRTAAPAVARTAGAAAARGVATTAAQGAVRGGLVQGAGQLLNQGFNAAKNWMGSRSAKRIGAAVQRELPGAVLNNGLPVAINAWQSRSANQGGAGHQGGPLDQFSPYRPPSFQGQARYANYDEQAERLRRHLIG